MHVSVMSDSYKIGSDIISCLTLPIRPAKKWAKSINYCINYSIDIITVMHVSIGNNGPEEKARKYAFSCYYAVSH